MVVWSYSFKMYMNREIVTSIYQSINCIVYLRPEKITGSQY
jgi:hypothetical protein